MTEDYLGIRALFTDSINSAFTSVRDIYRAYLVTICRSMIQYDWIKLFVDLRFEVPLL